MGLVRDGHARLRLDGGARAEAAQRVGQGPGVAARVGVDEDRPVVASLQDALSEAEHVVLHRARTDRVAACVDLGRGSCDDCTTLRAIDNFIQ